MKKMDKKTYELIKKKHGGWASWAIWAMPEVWEGAGSRANMDDVSFFEDDQILTKLNPNIVLVALNFSIDVEDIFEKPFQNFHGGARARDYLIRLMLKDTPFWGAYMTDIIKRTPAKKSEKAMEIWKNDSKLRSFCIETFKQELKDIGAVDPYIVCLGTDVYKILKEHLPSNYTIAEPYSYHYSAWHIKDEKHIERMQEVIENMSGAKNL